VSGTTQVSQYRKGKTSLYLLKQEIVSGSSISWTICKSAPRPRQITMPASHQSSFFAGRMPFLLPNQQHQSTEGWYGCSQRNKILYTVNCKRGGLKGAWVQSVHHERMRFSAWLLMVTITALILSWVTWTESAYRKPVPITSKYSR